VLGQFELKEKMRFCVLSAVAAACVPERNCSDQIRVAEGWNSI